MKIVVLLTDRFHFETEIKLKTNPLFELRKSRTAYPTEEELRGVQAIITRSRTQFDKEFLERAKDLKLLNTCTSGFDHIDLDATKAKKIAVMYTPDGNQYSATELTWALVLACAKKLPAAQTLTQKGKWERELVLGQELFGKTYGVIGFGRIGSRVAAVARAFGMKVLVYDPYVDDEKINALAATRVGLEEIFRICDIVSIHVPKSKETHHMIHKNFFEGISYESRKLIVVNTSRGNVLKEEDMPELLELGAIEMLGLDVYAREPLATDHPLLNHPKVVTTPHIGANTQEAFERVSELALQKLIAYFTQNMLSDELPPADAWYQSNQ